MKSKIPKPHMLEAKVIKSFPTKYYVESAGKVKCGNCGNTEFRVVIDHSLTAHLYCTKCNAEHVVAPGPWWGIFEG
jgi:ribosomal protein S27E